MTDSVIVSFAGGRYHGVIQTEEFKKIQSFKSHDHLFFIDYNKSWMNDVNLSDLISKCKKYKNVITIGNSMGAFSAATFAHYTNVDIAICFATQYSVHPDIVPWETRYIEFTEKIKNWKHKTLSLNNTTKYYFISGNNDIELKHLSLIPEQPNVKKIVIDNCGHDVTIKLKEQNKLYPLIKNIIEGNYNEV